MIYDEFYAALKQWGYFELVDSATQADLIFQIQGTEQLPDVENDGKGVLNKDYSATFYPPRLNLSTLDPSQHLLYKVVLPAGRAGNIPKGKIAFSKSHRCDDRDRQITELRFCPVSLCLERVGGLL